MCADVDVEKVVRENIDRTVHLSLATVDDNLPWVSEVHFAYDDKLNLYFRSLATRRHSLEIAKNPQVAGSIIDNYPLDTEDIIGVYFEGVARMVEGNERGVAADCLKKRLNSEDDMVAEANLEDGHKLYKITVNNWYVFGQFGQPFGTKHQLEWNK